MAKRSDYRTMEIPPLVALAFVVEELDAAKWDYNGETRRYGGVVVEHLSDSRYSRSQIEEALSWLVAHRFARYTKTNEAYHAELKLNGIKGAPWFVQEESTNQRPRISRRAKPSSTPLDPRET